MELYFFCLPLQSQNDSGCSAARLAHLLWEQRVPGSNPGTPTKKVENQHNAKRIVSREVLSFIFLHRIHLFDNLAFSPLELGIGDTGVKPGKCLFYFLAIFHNHNKATYIRSPFLLQSEIRTDEARTVGVVQFLDRKFVNSLAQVVVVDELRQYAVVVGINHVHRNPQRIPIVIRLVLDYAVDTLDQLRELRV